MGQQASVALDCSLPACCGERCDSEASSVYQVDIMGQDS